MRLDADIDLDLLSVTEQATLTYLVIKAMGFDAAQAMNDLFDELRSSEKGADVAAIMRRVALKSKVSRDEQPRR